MDLGQRKEAGQAYGGISTWWTHLLNTLKIITRAVLLQNSKFKRQKIGIRVQFIMDEWSGL